MKEELKEKEIPCAFEEFERWQEQMETDYENLTEKEKESDRKEVRKYLPLIKELISLAKEQERERIREILLGKKRTHKEVAGSGTYDKEGNDHYLNGYHKALDQVLSLITDTKKDVSNT